MTQETAKPTFSQRAAVSAWLSFWFVFVYNGCNYLTSLRSDVGTCAFAWELDLFPFLPILIIPYWSIDLLYVIAPFVIPGRFLLSQHLKRVTFGIAVAGLFFLLFPLKLAFTRPEVTGWLAPFFSSLDNFNNFYNCAPSLHIVLRTNLWAIYVTPLRGAPRWLLSFWFFLIGASTLFCWQHHIIDVVAGQILGIFCLWMFPSVELPRTPTQPKARINSSSKIAGFYGAVTLALLVLTVLGWPETVLFLWATVAFFVLTLAYAGGGPSFFRKTNGRQLLSTRWLLAPYRWVALLTARYFNAGHPAYGELRPGLFLGRRLTEPDARRVAARAVLDLTAEYDEVPAFLEREYKNVAILDLTLPSLEQLQGGVAFLREHPSCYVHCSLGLGRTCLIGAAYLIAQECLSVEDAIAEVRRVRPRLRFAHGAEALLEEFARA